MYLGQAEHGRVFVHEHPAMASSWKQGSIRKVWEKTAACIVDASMCCFGMTRIACGKTGRAFKPTWLMTTFPTIGALRKQVSILPATCA